MRCTRGRGGCDSQGKRRPLDATVRAAADWVPRVLLRPPLAPPALPTPLPAPSPAHHLPTTTHRHPHPPHARTPPHPPTSPYPHPHRYILWEAEDEGLELPYACRMGCCTACAVKVKSGELRQVEALGVSQELRDAGYGLMCVAYPVGDCELELADEDEVYELQFGRCAVKCAWGGGWGAGGGQGGGLRAGAC